MFSPPALKTKWRQGETEHFSKVTKSAKGSHWLQSVQGLIQCRTWSAPASASPTLCHAAGDSLFPSLFPSFPPPPPNAWAIHSAISGSMLRPIPSLGFHHCPRPSLMAATSPTKKQLHTTKKHSHPEQFIDVTLTSLPSSVPCRLLRHMFLPMVRWVDYMIFKVPHDPNHSMILVFCK